MNELAALLDDSLARLFATELTTDLRKRADGGPFPAELWSLCAAQGVDRLLVPESSGGAGAGWLEAFTLCRSCGEYAVPLPIAESALARWLLCAAEIDAPPGPLSVIPECLTLSALDRVSGESGPVPWGGHCEAVVGLATRSDKVYMILMQAPPNAWTAAFNVAGEPRDWMRVEELPVRVAPCALPAQAITDLGALLRAAQMAGAAAALLTRSIEYVRVRQQFGRPLAQFQVIQHNLARLAGGVAAMSAASSAGFQAMASVGFRSRWRRDARLAMAIAKCRASELVEMTTAIAHQVHGAMGFTEEFGLHFWTRRLWAWRAEFGPAAHWAACLGELAVRRGGAGLWEDLTAVLGR